ncbi:hypothetical protein Taro_040487 [Colocasia esculenta]|uniref:Retrotransposon gag domain-containing protein n=1 Tax=Colocasia esculenta TaxID=4460 RepID=A0A843WUQ0_COLES|nr:hypothetical protein [Colocasia esculenta]
MWTSEVELSGRGSGRQWVFVDSRSRRFGIRACSMAPRRRPREGVAEQVTRPEVGDAPPPQQTQPLPQDAHSGIVPPPPPPPQVAQGLDMTHFLEGMAQFVAQHRDAPVPHGDAVERTFRSMECVPEEQVLLASYQLQVQALTWWSAEWETTFQSRPLRQIPWQEFVVSFERAFCPTYVRTERLYQFLDLQQRDSTVFVRGLRPELRQALIVARVTDLDAAYQTAAALEADTLRTRARSAEDLGGSFGVIGGRQSRGSSRLGVFSNRQVSLRSRYNVLLLGNVTGVTRWVIWREIVLCYIVCRSSRPSHSPECSSSSSSSRHQCSSVSKPELLLGDLSSWEAPGSCGVARSGGKRKVLA